MQICETTKQKCRERENKMSEGEEYIKENYQISHESV